jgi:hypothetical protein
VGALRNLKEGEVAVFDKAYVDFQHLQKLGVRGWQKLELFEKQEIEVLIVPITQFGQDCLTSNILQLFY